MHSPIEFLRNQEKESWTPMSGVLFPEDFRENFGEKELFEFRVQLMEQYPELELTGLPGGFFDFSTMMVEKGTADPIGDHVVESIVVRDGYPQHGLCAKEGGPILLAVVRVKKGMPEKQKGGV